MVDEIAAKSAAQLRNAIGLTPVGQVVELTHERKGSRATARVRIEPGERTAAGRTVRPAPAAPCLGQPQTLRMLLPLSSPLGVNRMFLDEHSNETKQLLMLWSLP